MTCRPVNSSALAALTLFGIAALGGCAQRQTMAAAETSPVAPTRNASLETQLDELTPPANPHLGQSAWPTSHRNGAKQASTETAGPSGDVEAAVRFFEEDAGRNLGASPYLVVSDKTYAGHPEARVVWGATLDSVYKYVIDRDLFEIADHYRTAPGPYQLSWNLFTLSKGNRLLAPMPIGMRSSSACAK